MLQDSHGIPDTEAAAVGVVQSPPGAAPAVSVPQNVAPGVGQHVTGLEQGIALQHPTVEHWKDRDACIRELMRASEETSLLRQSLEHMTKAYESYQQQLQEVLDQRNMLYRHHASAVLQMKVKHVRLEQTNTNLKQVNEDVWEQLCALKAAKTDDIPQDKHASMAAEVVVLRHKLLRV